MKNFNEILGKLNFLEGASQILWCNFELLLVVKKFWKNCRETLEYRSWFIFRSFWCNFGERKNFAIVFTKPWEKFYRNVKGGEIWVKLEKKFKKYLKIFRKIRKEFGRNRKHIFKINFLLISVEISDNFQRNFTKLENI